MMLDALGNRLCGIDSQRVLEMFSDTLHGLSCVVGNACDSDPIDVFRLELLAELADEPF